MLTEQTNKRLLRETIRLGKEIGHTPMAGFTHLVTKKDVRLFAKKEWAQLSGSVKARAAYAIIRHAVESGELNDDRILLDATSGNTGIAYAAIGKKLGIRVMLCVPENVTRERKQILTGLGAEIIFTSKYEGTDGAQLVAREMVTQSPDKYFYADQYRNDNNWKAHYETTAVEIISEQPGITHFVAGLGTSGTFVGTGRRLKEYNSGITLVALHPDSAMHGLEGWKHMETAIVPAIYDAGVSDVNMEISTEEAYEMIRFMAREGLLLSPSSAANLAGAMKVIDQIDHGIVVTMLPDDASKYSELLHKLL